MELGDERLHLGEELVEEGHHLAGAHVVVGDLEREEVVVAHLLGDAVAEVAELEEPGPERRADLLRGLPGRAALREVAALHEDPVEVVGRDRLFAGVALAGEAELEAVEDGGHLGLLGHTGPRELGVRHGGIGRLEENLAELPRRLGREVPALLEEPAHLTDELRVAGERRVGRGRAGPEARVLLRDVRARRPAGPRDLRAHGGVERRVEREEPLRLLLRAGDGLLARHRLGVRGRLACRLGSAGVSASPPQATAKGRRVRSTRGRVVMERPYRGRAAASERRRTAAPQGRAARPHRTSAPHVRAARPHRTSAPHVRAAPTPGRARPGRGRGCG